MVSDHHRHRAGSGRISRCTSRREGYRGLMTFLILFLASVWAGIQNALAGGGSFITLPSLILTGMDARAANITSTVALFPGQIVSGLTNRRYAGGAAGLSLRALIAIS